MEDWTISIIMLFVGVIIFLIHFFTKQNGNTLFANFPEHVQITGFSIKPSLSNNNNRYYIGRYKNSSSNRT